MPVRNWRDSLVTKDASVLYNNPHRAITWLVPGPDGALVDRRTTEPPSGKVRISDVDMPDEVNCLRAIQFVHHAFIPPGGLHAPEAHEHPDAEEVFYIIAGRGEFRLGATVHQVGAGDCVYIPPDTRHALTNTGEEPLEFVDFSVPVRGNGTPMNADSTD